MNFYQLVVVYPINEERQCPECGRSVVEDYPFLAADDEAAKKMAEAKVGPLEYAYKSGCLAWGLRRMELTDEPGKAKYTLILEREGTWVI